MKVDGIRLKYVLFTNDDFVLLPQSMSHKDFKILATKPGLVPVSAGFCSIHNNGDSLLVSCDGESITLGIRSRPEDHVYIGCGIKTEF